MTYSPPYRVLSINAGSSSIKFALFESGDSLLQILDGSIDRIGLSGSCFSVKASNAADSFSRPVDIPDHTAAVSVLMDWIEQRLGQDFLAAVGHRIVQGGPKFSQPQRINADMIAELHRLSPFDPEHLQQN